MNALGSSVMGDDDVPHGTPEGWHAGCRGSSCPAAAVGLSCTTAHRRYAGDYAFRKLVDSGLTVLEIVAVEGGLEERPKPKRRAQRKRAQDLGSSRPHTLRDLAETAAVVEAADEVTIGIEPVPTDLARRLLLGPTAGFVSAAEEDAAAIAKLEEPQGWQHVGRVIAEEVNGIVQSFRTEPTKSDVALVPMLAPAEGLPGAVSLQVPEVWRVSDGPAFEVAERIDPEPLAAEAVAGVEATGQAERVTVAPRPFQGRTEAHSVEESEQIEAAVKLAALGARRRRAWATIEEVREPSNVLVLRLVELGMTQVEVAELAGISSASVNALVKANRKGRK